MMIASGTPKQPVPAGQDEGAFPGAAPEAAPNIQAPQQGVTARVAIISLVVAALFGVLCPIIDHLMCNTFLGTTHLPPGALAVLGLLILVVNPALRLVKRFRLLSQGEVLIVYMTCLFSVLVAGHGSENMFVSCALGPFYFASRENQWLSWLVRYVPGWMTPALHNGHYDNAGRAAVEQWYLGNGGQVPWNLWVAPVAMWSLLVLTAYFMFACLAVMLRAQWVKNEALAFPLLRLPLAMVGTDGDDKLGSRFFRNPTMWLGFGLAAVMQFTNGLNYYFPDVPSFPLHLDTAPYLTELPWNQIGGLSVDIWPMVIGIGFLLTTEVSFSLWAFVWLYKLQFVAAYYLGFMPASLPDAAGSVGQTKAFQGYQHMGCILMYVALLAFNGRVHWAHIARRACGREPATSHEAEEAMSYPAAFWGFCGAMAVLIAWSVAAGMTPFSALALWVFYVILAVALTRVVVEAGLLSIQPGWEALGRLGQLGGSGAGTWLAPSSIVPGTMIQTVMATGMSSILLPSFVQSFKLAYDHNIRPRPLLGLIGCCILLSWWIGVFMHIKMGYIHGGLTLDSWYGEWGAKWPALKADELLNGATGQSWSNWFWLAVGAAATFCMIAARARFAFFPLHPIGYMMALTYPMRRLWFSIALGWLCKVLISRFGGTSTYRQVTPFFLGLVLGDVAMMLFWLAIDGWQGRTHHFLMPE